MYKELIGKYLNGYKIVRIEKDPFIKEQINLWTDEEIGDFWGDKKIVKFFVREDSNSNKIYQELIDKELYELKEKQKRFIEWLENESKEIIRDAGYHQKICIDILEKYKEIIGDDK